VSCLYWNFFSLCLSHIQSQLPHVSTSMCHKKNMCIPFALFREFFFLPSFSHSHFFSVVLFFHINFHFLLLHFFLFSFFCNAFTADFFFLLFSCIVGVCRKNYKLQTHTTDDFFFFDGGCCVFFVINKILFFCFSSFRQPARDFIAYILIIITDVNVISVIVWHFSYFLLSISC